MDDFSELKSCQSCMPSERIQEAHIRLEIYRSYKHTALSKKPLLEALREIEDFVFGYRPATADSSTTDTTSDIGQANTV